MKKKIKVVSKLGNQTVEINGEKSQRNTLHLQAQINNPSRVFTPKKGKGSYKRNKKEVYDENV